MEELKTRPVKEAELILIQFLLAHIKTDEHKFPISDTAFEYEAGKMGSINLVNKNQGEYKGDIAIAQYIDSDGIIVMITLTIDSNDNLLDLDFWKTNFEKLLKYPSPSDLTFDNFKEIR
jgi:hypothetical protein